MDRHPVPGGGGGGDNLLPFRPFDLVIFEKSSLSQFFQEPSRIRNLWKSQTSSPLPRVLLFSKMALKSNDPGGEDGIGSDHIQVLRLFELNADYKDSPCTASPGCFVDSN